MTKLALPSAADVDAAARVLAPVAVRTRLITSPALDALTGGRIFLKPEVLQRTGSFKFRGAYNKLSSIPEAARKAGVVAFSSGNHAQGVAAAAQLLDMPAVIVMPSDAPAIKIANTKAYGAEVVTYDRELMRALRGREGVEFVDFERLLDDAIARLPQTCDQDVQALWAEAKLFYFDHNQDPDRERPFRARLQLR